MKWSYSQLHDIGYHTPFLFEYSLWFLDPFFQTRSKSISRSIYLHIRNILTRSRTNTPERTTSSSISSLHFLGGHLSLLGFKNSDPWTQWNFGLRCTGFEGTSTLTKRCHLSLLTNSAQVYESQCGGTGGLELRGPSQQVQLCTSRDMEPK